MGAAETIYLLCAATSVVAAWMLLRYYLVRRTPLLLWSCIGFMGLAANSALVFVDLVLFREIDLSLPRTLAGAAGMMALVYRFDERSTAMTEHGCRSFFRPSQRRSHG
jgi:hypothetical protein